MRNTLRGNNMGLYWCWKAIKQRCNNPNCHAYHNYGGRGIKVCVEWNEFEPFYEWAVANGYKKGLEIDRKNNNGDYCPENCRWVDRKTNSNNTRKTTRITVDGVTKSSTEWDEFLNIRSGAVYNWYYKGGCDYAAERIKETMRDGYTQNDYIRNHKCKSVVCLETGEEFYSMKEAARVLGLNSGNISRVARTKGAAGGYHFQFS